MANHPKGIRKPEIATAEVSVRVKVQRNSDGVFSYFIPNTNSEIKCKDLDEIKNSIINNCCEAPDIIANNGTSLEGYKLNEKRWKYESRPTITKVINAYYEEVKGSDDVDYADVSGTIEYTYTLNNFR